MIYGQISSALLILASLSSREGELESRLSEPNIYENQSVKKIVDLEFCVARSVSSGALPLGAYRDGPKRLVIYGNRIAEMKVFLIVILTETDQGTKIEVKGRNPDALKGFRETLESCI